MYISVVGASSCGASLKEAAYKVGYAIAQRTHIMVCGGLTGVMDAAAHGCHDAGGISVGILPGPDRQGASRWLSVALPTELGQSRNSLVARAGDALIAIGGGYGTLSEIAFGLKMGRPVVGLMTWELPDCEGVTSGVRAAEGPLEAVLMAERLAGGSEY